jgi:hypothetical protein
MHMHMNMHMHLRRHVHVHVHVNHSNPHFQAHLYTTLVTATHPHVSWQNATKPMPFKRIPDPISNTKL